MSRTVAILRDVAASRAAGRQYRLDARRHLDEADRQMRLGEIGPAGRHLQAADYLGYQSLIEKLREPKP